MQTPIFIPIEQGNKEQTTNLPINEMMPVDIFINILTPIFIILIIAGLIIGITKSFRDKFPTISSRRKRNLFSTIRKIEQTLPKNTEEIKKTTTNQQETITPEGKRRTRLSTILFKLKCDRCNTKNHPDDKYCAKCGEHLHEL